MSSRALSFSDRIALIALVLSVSNAAYSLFQWWRGADVRMAPPVIVQLQSDCGGVRANDDGEVCAKREHVDLVADSFAYTNYGTSSMSAILLHEMALVQTGAVETNVHWKYFVEYVEGQSGRDAENVAPTLIPGRGALGHETEMLPREDAKGSTDREQRAQFLDWADFTEELQSTQKALIVFTSFVLEDGVIRRFDAECKIQFTDEEIRNLQDPKYARTVKSCSYDAPVTKRVINREDMPDELASLTNFL